MATQRRRHIEELRDALHILGNDAASLYQYGGVGESLRFFKELSDWDKRRLIAVALFSGDRGAASVGRYLLGLLDSAHGSEQSLLSQLSEADKSEAKLVFEVGEQEPIGGSLATFVNLQLEAAVERMKSLKLESACWLLIQRTSGFDSVWVDACRQSSRGSAAAGLKLATEFVYEPDSSERAKLFGMMRKSVWIFHLHNHPNNTSTPSEADRRFVLYWKAQRPELACKMKFFIVSGGHAVEYMKGTVS